MIGASIVVLALSAVPTPTPTPLPFNPDDVTPGVIGFAFTFIVFILVGLIAWDMLRRVRRARYREEVRSKIAAEVAERDGDPADRESDRDEGEPNRT